MNEGLLTLLKGGGAMSILAALLYIAPNLIEKYKPKAERRAINADLHAQEIEALTKRVKFAEEQVEKMRTDVAQLRNELRRASLERHYFYNAIVRCSTEHPMTADWWTKELEGINQRIST